MKRTRLAPILLLAAAPGCTLGPDYQRPDVAAPAAWVRPAATGESMANLPWWQLFKDEALQGLIRKALEENKDLKIALARIDEARAALGYTRADQYPVFGASAGMSRNRYSSETPLSPGGTHNDFTLAGGVSYEVDLWGKYRRATEASLAELLATEESRRTVTIALVAGVAGLYFRLRDADARLEIARRTQAGRRDSLALVRQRFQGGLIPEMDVRQAEIEEAVASAAIPRFERAVAETEHALSLLLGRSPGAIPRGRALADQVFPPDVPAGLPSQLLDRRPDLLVAEHVLHAQTAQIGVAEALRLPAISLTGALGLQSADLSDLAKSGAVVGGLAAGLVSPLFNFGKNDARVEIERARTEQAVQAYLATVLNAFREVEDALVGVRTWRDEHAAVSRQVASARVAASLSRARYDGGVTAYLEVLDAERSLFDAELQASEALRERYAAVVSLYKALGGGWNPESPQEPAPQKP